MEHRTAIDLARDIKRRAISPTEALEESLAAIEDRNPALNAIIWLDEHDHRARARAADDLVASADADDLPPFCGVPIPVKDLYDVEGWPNTLGSEGASADPRPSSGLVVQRLVDAGFVLCGRSNSPEFGSVTATENERYGITRNPWDTDRTPGGSSGGASAAVAGELFTIAHASDGGGSIRLPATCTGLVGLKPGRGRVNDKVMSWEGASTQGVVTHSVADTAAALDVMARFDPLAWYNAPAPDRPFLDEVGADPGRLRIAVATVGAFGWPTDPECIAAVESTRDALATAGHEIVDHEFQSYIDAFVAHFGEVVGAGLSANPVDWDRVQPSNRVAYDRAGEVDSLKYATGIRELQTWTREVNAQWGRDFDLLLTPTMVVQPPEAGLVLDGLRDAPERTPETVLAMVLFTAIFNVNGLPAISLPVHQASDTGLPVGAQLVGGPWQEATLLRVSAQVESALPWIDRRPAMVS